VLVVIIEDDDTIAEPLAKGLAREGYDVERFDRGEAALRRLQGDRADPVPAVVLLDLGLPDFDGFELCRLVRGESDIPIIVVTARGEEVDRVVGLELGADDYIVKPFGFRELVARIRAVTRRLQHRAVDAEPMCVGALEIDLRTRRVALGGEEIPLTPKEFDLLALLAADPGAVCSRTRILEEVWDPHWYGPTKTLDVHVASLRKKLGDPSWIETVRGVGFRLRAPE
jgi:two-component system, OmpR family, response regulator RegX3